MCCRSRLGCTCLRVCGCICVLVCLLPESPSPFPRVVFVGQRSPSSQRREACAGAETHTLALQAVATRSQQLRHLRLLSRGYSGARNRTRARSLDAGGAADDDDDGGRATHKAVCVPLSWIHGNAEGGVTTAKDASARQAALDLERDVVRSSLRGVAWWPMPGPAVCVTCHGAVVVAQMSVNGTMHKGSDGYDAVLGAVVAAMASAEAGVIGTLEPPPATVLQDFARTVLQRGNRTVSGGDAYDAVSTSYVCLYPSLCAVCTGGGSGL